MVFSPLILQIPNDIDMDYYLCWFLSLFMKSLLEIRLTIYIFYEFIYSIYKRIGKFEW